MTKANDACKEKWGFLREVALDPRYSDERVLNSFWGYVQCCCQDHGAVDSQKIARALEDAITLLHVSNRAKLADSLKRAMQTVPQIDDIHEDMQSLMGRLTTLRQKTVNPGGDEDLWIHLSHTLEIVNAAGLAWANPAFTDVDKVGYLKIAIDEHLNAMLETAQNLASNWPAEIKKEISGLRLALRALRVQLN